MNDHPQPMGIVQITAAVILTVILGWLAVVGQSLLLPLIIGIIIVFVLTEAAEALTRLPGVGRWSQRARRALAGFLVLVLLVALVGFFAGNAAAITAALPTYSENLTGLITQVSGILGVEKVPSLENLFTQLREQVDMSSMVTSLLSGLTSTGTFLFTALLYAMFILADWDGMADKTRRAMDNPAAADQALKIARNITDRIGRYLSAKTLINVILGGISLVVMWVIGIEFAIFWAILIGLLNYIPYIGSILGVLFPVVLALVQFPSPVNAGVALVALMGAQIYVGNVLEPRMLGKAVDMSPIVVLIALSFWMSIWGVIGAILAVPLTAMIIIILAEIPQTRPIAVMMSGDAS